MNKKEQQIIDMMKALDISREEAEELVAFDNEEFELEEVNEMTEKAKKADKGTKRGRPAGTKHLCLPLLPQERQEGQLSRGALPAGCRHQDHQGTPAPQILCRERMRAHGNGNTRTRPTVAAGDIQGHQLPHRGGRRVHR